ncbi:hypothetical protein PspLS_09062 [Pyricularia sp. CBS 133598]|nr:hypothetical protein PspLS_09062 [Pyricularia sp. CBS 133598]
MDSIQNNREQAGNQEERRGGGCGHGEVEKEYRPAKVELWALMGEQGYVLPCPGLFLLTHFRLVSPLGPKCNPKSLTSVFICSRLWATTPFNGCGENSILVENGTCVCSMWYVCTCAVAFLISACSMCNRHLFYSL